MKIIGLMSGTSADGIDAALCEINGAPPQIQARIIRGITIPYSHEFRRWILDACVPETSHVDALCQLNFDIGEQFAAAALQLIEQLNLKPQEIDLIGSHGQTVWHNVLSDGQVGSTLQIGEAAVIAERTGITTISNFRVRDVAAGGQGAPLTAFADWLLLRHSTQWRAVQNIGGIGNVTFLPPLSDIESQPIAFDTGPGNVLIDAATTLLTDGAQTYDQDGHLAEKGKVDEIWLNKLLQHPYYAQAIPKTTGRELFSSQMATQLVSEGQKRNLTSEDILATLTMLTAKSIADAYYRFAPYPIQEVIVGGGGSRNPTLMSMLKHNLSPISVTIHEEIGLDSDFKEALVFALLAHEMWHGRPNTLPSITGAKHSTISGDITPGANYPDLIRSTWGHHLAS
jgi:anhydro-N-acetylmuramic acid kinase